MFIQNVLVSALVATSVTQASKTDVKGQNRIYTYKRSIAGLLDWATGLLGGSRREETCPAIWNEISTTLTEQFLADGQCTDAARMAIRASFHDCFNGACDGSLILANECTTRSENKGIISLCGNLADLASQTGVGVADLIQFAAAHAIKTCPGGPTIPVVVGRQDSREANEAGILPSGHADGGALVDLFASKGFSAVDLAALIGAHTAARQRFVDPSRAGEPLDSTVGTWDNKFYSETISDQAPFTLPSDKSVSQNPLTSGPFSAFASSKSAWDEAFVSAMTRLSMLGVDSNDLIDCTSALPGGSMKREIRASDLWERLKR